MLFGTIAFLLSTIHLSGVFMIDCFNCFPKLEPIAKKMIVNTMATMVLRDAILDDITSVNSMMWYINLLITLFHRCDAVARSTAHAIVHKNLPGAATISSLLACGNGSPSDSLLMLACAARHQLFWHLSLVACNCWLRCFLIVIARDLNEVKLTQPCGRS